FLMGDDTPTGGPGYEPFYVPGDYPVRTDMEMPEDAAPLDELGAWDIDPEETAATPRDVADFLPTLCAAGPTARPSRPARDSHPARARDPLVDRFVRTHT